MEDLEIIKNNIAVKILRDLSKEAKKKEAGKSSLSLSKIKLKSSSKNTNSYQDNTENYETKGEWIGRNYWVMASMTIGFIFIMSQMKAREEKLILIRKKRFLFSLLRMDLVM